MTIVELCVHMDCPGCESRIRKALYKLEGVDEVDIDMAMQKVTVMGYVEQTKVLKAVRKTGRWAVLWPYPYNTEYQHDNHQDYHQHHQTQSRHHNADPYLASSSSYNYRKNGYNGFDMHGYYQRPAYFSFIDEKACNLFSDENPNACSVM